MESNITPPLAISINSGTASAIVAIYHEICDNPTSRPAVAEPVAKINAPKYLPRKEMKSCMPFGQIPAGLDRDDQRVRPNDLVKRSSSR
ncbi:hypothetical protein C5Y96_10665 [Blastopirellula marina]|uniref:Uncharacterized protein n=1 Tax=Blastopirellula marina TaxID=124 RepID=A0A2S8FMB9_9BACT|nr:hypothetical protein C5Y96_10665 [Blastopirellula marina]RCS52394.1 hypothetical protein DTL36_10675 [Bremerella cremea]